LAIPNLPTDCNCSAQFEEDMVKEKYQINKLLFSFGRFYIYIPLLIQKLSAEHLLCMERMNALVSPLPIPLNGQNGKMDFKSKFLKFPLLFVFLFLLEFSPQMPNEQNGTSECQPCEKNMEVKNLDSESFLFIFGIFTYKIK
jgi:hypothetical protein